MIMKKRKSTYRRVSVSLPVYVVEALDAAAKREVRSRSQQVALFLTNAVSRRDSMCDGVNRP